MRSVGWDALGLLIVACIIALLAARVLSRSIARPILHTVGLLERFRAGDIVDDPGLFGEPRVPHEAGVLVAAVADANAALGRLASGGERLAAGDLTVQLVPSSERDMVAIAFRKVVEAMRTVVSDVRTTAELLENSADALRSRAEDFAKDARANAGDLTGAVRTVGTLDETVSRVARGAEELTEMAVRPRSVSAMLRRAMRRASISSREPPLRRSTRRATRATSSIPRDGAPTSQPLRSPTPIGLHKRPRRS
jgi:methyl-accepting chemotaxis protein